MYKRYDEVDFFVYIKHTIDINMQNEYKKAIFFEISKKEEIPNSSLFSLKSCFLLFRIVHK